VTRQVEDKLSDALHERLASRFVDRRTSVLMRRLRENVMLEAEITAAGEVTVEGQHVGSLLGFHFVPDSQAGGDEAARTLRNAAGKGAGRRDRGPGRALFAAADAALVLSNDGTVRWQGDPVGKLEPGDLISSRASASWPTSCSRARPATRSRRGSTPGSRRSSCGCSGRCCSCRPPPS
jgi:ATP-dependent RNA helicase SUPV3L1/SUV3